VDYLAGLENRAGPKTHGGSNPLSSASACTRSLMDKAQDSGSCDWRFESSRVRRHNT
jgi:hypothetical protein